MRGEQDVQDLGALLKVNRRAFYRHDFYQRIYRPLGYRHFIRVVLREGGRALGRLHLFRADDAEFSPRDKQRLAAIAPFIAHALACAGNLDAPLVESPETGLIIADPSGRIRHYSEQARRLLWLARGPQSPPERVTGHGQDLMLPEGARRLCRRLDGVFKNDERSSPPACQHRNAWGGFNFRAYWLREGELNGAPEPTSLIGITISRLEPLSLKLMRHIEQLPLSGRQVESLLLLASGHSLTSIAERLDISKHTADYHCREIYARLDVHNRAELISKLLLT